MNDSQFADFADQDFAAAIAQERIVPPSEGHRVVIVAEAKTKDEKAQTTFFVEVFPSFNQEMTAVLLEFSLSAHDRNGKNCRVTIREGVVEKALKEKQSVIFAAMRDQYAWVEINFPGVYATIFQAYQERNIPLGAGDPDPHAKSI